MLTVYGIETYQIQTILYLEALGVLQQCLPFTVLKPEEKEFICLIENGCNSAYRLRYWNIII